MSRRGNGPSPARGRPTNLTGDGIRPSARGRVGRVLIAAAVAALALVAPAAAAPARAASAADPCLAAGKVWLVVVTETGSALTNSCVGTPATGYAALNASGLGYTLAPPPRGYVCTIGGHPTCPAEFRNQYWSYWKASPGGSFSYATVGAQGKVRPGTIYGWCYTPDTSQAAQQSRCRSMLTAVLNPATASAVAPTRRPASPAPGTTVRASSPTTRTPTTPATTAKPGATAGPQRPSTGRPGAPSAATGPSTPGAGSSTRPSPATTPTASATAAPASASGTPTVASSASPGASRSGTPGVGRGTDVADGRADGTAAGASDAASGRNGSVVPLAATGAVVLVGAGATGWWLRRRGANR